MHEEPIFSGKLAELIKIARYANKRAFVDPATAAGGGAPPMDPAMMGGGAPPMDPAMMGGGAPAAPAGVTAEEVRAIVQQAVGSVGGGIEPIKPKIDVNVEIMQMKKLLARIADALHVPISAEEMVATPEDLTQMAEGGAGYAAMTPDGTSPGAGGTPIKPIEPMGGAAPKTAFAYGRAHTDGSSMQRLSDRAAAMAMVLSQRRG